jgi:hypothetical protein
MNIALSVNCTGALVRVEFGEQGDWGVVNPDWGTAFLETLT